MFDFKVRDSILSSTGFQGGQLPFRYLGTPLASSKLRSSDYSMLLDAVAAKINARPRASLSHAEKKDSLWIKWVNQFYGSHGPIWNWDRNKDASPLIEQLIGICNEMVEQLGTVDLAKSRLSSWFSGQNGITKAYDFFVHKVGLWPWKPLIWKSCIMPKHRFVLWLFAHGKLLTRDCHNYIEDKVCVFCNLEGESVAHLFFECSVTILIWNDVRSWLRMEKLMMYVHHRFFVHSEVFTETTLILRRFDVM